MKVVLKFSWIVNNSDSGTFEARDLKVLYRGLIRYLDLNSL